MDKLNILWYFYDNYSQYFPFFLAREKLIHENYADFGLQSIREIIELSTEKTGILNAKTRKALKIKKASCAV